MPKSNFYCRKAVVEICCLYNLFSSLRWPESVLKQTREWWEFSGKPAELGYKQGLQ